VAGVDSELEEEEVISGEEGELESGEVSVLVESSEEVGGGLDTAGLSHESPSEGAELSETGAVLSGIAAAAEVAESGIIILREFPSSGVPEEGAGGERGAVSFTNMQKWPQRLSSTTEDPALGESSAATGIANAV